MNKKELDTISEQQVYQYTSDFLERMQQNTLDELEFELYENELGINEDIIRSIIAEDDWGFIIKGHAFIEAVFSSLLTKHIKENDGVKKVITFLPLSDARIGKLELAEYVLGLKKEHKRYIKRLSRIRNAFAHDVKYVSSDLSQYLANMDKNQEKEFLKDFAWTNVTPDTFMKHPRKCITISFLMMLCIIEIMFSKHCSKEHQAYMDNINLQKYKSQLETEKLKSQAVELRKDILKLKTSTNQST